MRKCRYCSKEIQDASRVCEHCGAELAPPAAAPLPIDPHPGSIPVARESAHATALVQTVMIQPSPATSAQVLSRIVWGLAFVAIALAALDGAVGFSRATSAPQQAAAAAMGCFYVIVPYVGARALTSVLGGA